MTMVPHFLGETIELSPKAFWRAQAFSVNPKILLQIPLGLSSRAVLKKLPTITTNIIHTCRVGFHVAFSSTVDVMGYGPKLPSCQPKREVCDTLNQWEFKNS